MSRPQPLWRAWPQIASRLAAASRVALFSDFDGTLAPIVRHPQDAKLPSAARRALERLARHRRLAVTMVSGRSLADLRQRVGLQGIYYIGTHGIEWAGRGGRRHVGVAAGFAAAAQSLGEALETRLGRLPGIFVERKAVSVAVHYRNAVLAVALRARRLVREAARNSRHSLRVLEGLKVIELLPPGRASKGRAVLAMADRLRHRGKRPLVIYLGDDVTDESVFRRLRPTDLGIHVGQNEASAARYRLRSPAEVTRWLRRLEEALQ